MSLGKAPPAFNEGMVIVLRRIILAALAAAGLLIIYSPAFADSCWDGVAEQQDVGFDFGVISDVQGPDIHGLYTYTYRLYRVDQGRITYRDPSHISIRFECEGEAASSIILDGDSGITLGGESESVCSLEVAEDSYGFNEPGLGQDCHTNGMKVGFCEGGLVPDGDGVSYPTDPDDPVLIVSFKSVAPPTEGLWFVKGGRDLSGAVGKNGTKPLVRFLTDGGGIRVPACRPPVPVEATSWSRVKQMYR